MPRRPYVIPLPGGRELQLGHRTLVMGVLNVTPDSFSDGGGLSDVGAVVEAAARMVEGGADILDIGGESTRPGAVPVSAETERTRVVPVLRALAGRVSIPLSIDTYKADVARAALDEGALLVNDISGLRYDPGLAGVVAARGAALVLTHTRGRPSDMYGSATYGSVVHDVATELEASIALALAAGVRRDALLLDPGLGFGKRAEQSLTMLASLDAAPLGALDRPLLVGPSRKSFLTTSIGPLPPAERDWATAGAVAAAILFGAHVVRVHRVKEMVQVARLADAIVSRRP